MAISQGKQLTVTMTGGLTMMNPDELLHDAIGRTDKAMYYGKQQGRNRCFIAHQGKYVETGEVVAV